MYSPAGARASTLPVNEVALIFYPLWIGMLLPLMQTGEQIDSLYSIFVLDLCFIMPAFLILSVLTYRDHGTGLLLLPAIYVLGFTLIFSLAVGDLVKTHVQRHAEPSCILVGTCAVPAIPYPRRPALEQTAS